MKNIFSIVLLILAIAPIKTFSQNCLNKTDTLYYLEVLISKGDSSRPLSGGALVKSTTESINIDHSSAQAFIENLYSLSIYTSDPFWGFQEMSNCFNKNKQKTLTKSFFRQQQKMINRQTKFKTILKDSSTVQIDVVKVIGDFWILDTDFSKINVVNHAVKLYPSFYKKKYFFLFKEIIKTYKLNTKEKDEFKKSF